MTKHTILFLAANPTGTSELALGEEARAIQAELERSGHRDCFDLQTRWAAQPLDLLRELRKLKPTVVHFSGHRGHSPIAGPRRGLYFQGPDGRPQAVTAQALQDTFGAAGASVQLVVLSACHSDAQAEQLRAHVDCVAAPLRASGDLHDCRADLGAGLRRRGRADLKRWPPGPASSTNAAHQVGFCPAAGRYAMKTPRRARFRGGAGGPVMSESEPLSPRDQAERVALFRAELIGAVSRRELSRGETAAALRALAAERYLPAITWSGAPEAPLRGAATGE